MTFHQVGKVLEQKSSPAASSFEPGMTAAVLLPSVGEQQKRSNNKPSINHIPDTQVHVAPRWLPSLSEHRRVCCAAQTPQKDWVRSCPGDSAGCAGTGKQQVTQLGAQREAGGGNAGRALQQAGKQQWPPTLFSSKIPSLVALLSREWQGWQCQRDSTAPGLQCQGHPVCCEAQALQAQQVLGPASPAGCHL